MKLIFFLFVLLKKGMKPTEGQLTALFSSREIILRIYFDPFYNPFEKRCCKLVEWGCVIIGNSRGQVAPGYQGRVFRANYNGAFEIKITNPSVTDAGIYRCGVSEIPTTYNDFEVTVSDLKKNFVIGRNSVPLPTKSNIRPQVQTSTFPSTLLGEKHTEEHSSESQNMVFTLAAVCTIVAFAVIILSVLLVFHLKRKSRVKSGTCGFRNNTLEQNEVTYSVVFFKSHHDPSELYANLQIQSPRHAGPSACTLKTVESVEYSSISRAQT